MFSPHSQQRPSRRGASQPSCNTPQQPFQRRLQQHVIHAGQQYSNHAELRER